MSFRTAKEMFDEHNQPGVSAEMGCQCADCKAYRSGAPVPVAAVQNDSKPVAEDPSDGKPNFMEQMKAAAGKLGVKF